MKIQFFTTFAVQEFLNIDGNKSFWQNFTYFQGAWRRRRSDDVKTSNKEQLY